VATPPLSDDEVAFFAAIGRGISHWSGIERALAILCSVLLYGTRKRFTTAAAAFYAVESLRAKVQVIDDLITAQIESAELVAQWAKVKRHLEKRASKRNRLAHHEVVQRRNGDPGRAFCLIAPLANPLKLKHLDRDLRPMYLKDIETARAEFHQLEQEIHDLRRAIETHAQRH
jgi:hypothetical protein